MPVDTDPGQMQGVESLFSSRVRRLLELVVPARARFYLLRVVALILPSRVGARAFFQVLSELRAEHAAREIVLCWRQLHRMAPTDTSVSLRRILAVLDLGDLKEAARAMDDAARMMGVPPRNLVYIAGQLARSGHFRSAGQMLVRLSRLPGGGRLIAQSPSIVSARIPSNLGVFGAKVASAGLESNFQALSFARLCFSLKNFDVAAALYRSANLEVPLDSVDRIAMMYALAASSPGGGGAMTEGLQELGDELTNNVDALGAAAKVAVIAKELEIAREAMLAVIRSHFGEREDFSDLVEDCEAILQVMADLRDTDERVPEVLRKRVRIGEAGIQKVFVCGFGWSGSGAVYDDIRGVQGFCEFEGAGHDAIINEDADSETTFIQAPGGLGDLWKRVSMDGSVPWEALWQTFSLHVIGLSSIGYVEYKSCAAARNHVRRYGALYTRPFRRFLEGYAAMRERPVEGGLHALLMQTSESLCAMLVEQTGAKAVLFNNAVFGRDALMLEVFRSCRAAIVYRDPRDVYVDRREKDRNHWRTAAQAAAFYAYSLRRYRSYKLGNRDGDPKLREVPFERFVKDECFRHHVRDWLLGGIDGSKVSQHFDPDSSIRNIGIHTDELDRDELEQMHPAVAEYLALNELSEISWRA